MQESKRLQHTRALPRSIDEDTIYYNTVHKLR